MNNRMILSRLLLVLFGFLLLAAMEGLLRLSWEPPEPNQFLQTRISPFQQVEELLVTKPEFLGALRMSRFAVEKGPLTFRIFCLGGSTTFGYPYAPEVAWPARLQKQLSSLYPEVDFEVINVGGTSYGSARTLGVLRSILDYSPDLIVVCVGDAEFVEDSYRVAFAAANERVTGLESLYLAKMIRSVLPENQSGQIRRVVDIQDKSLSELLFAPVLHGTVYHPDYEKRIEVIKHFRDNLSQISVETRNAGVPLLFCTVPSNLRDWPPDPLPLPENPGFDLSRWKQAFSAARQSFNERNYAAASERFHEAESIWSGDPSLHFEYGTALSRQELHEEALPHFILARDLDAVPVRATSEINRIIREIAEQQNVATVDLVQALAGKASHGVVGSELILDYAHPTVDGHGLIAFSVLQAITTKPGNFWSPPSPEQLDALEQMTMEETGSLVTMNADLAFVWGQIYERKQLLEKSAEMFLLAIEKGYDGPYAEVNLANVYWNQGKGEQARKILQKLIRDYPGFEEPYTLLARIEAEDGNHESAQEISGGPENALQRYREAENSGVHLPKLYFSWGITLLDMRRYLAAEEVINRGLQYNPGDCRLLATKGRVLEGQGHSQKALDWYSQLLDQSPECQLGWENLGLLQISLGQWSDAEETFLAALNRSSPPPYHYLNLGYVYFKGLQDNENALRMFKHFIELQADDIALIPEEFRMQVLSEN